MFFHRVRRTEHVDENVSREFLARFLRGPGFVKMDYVFDVL